MFVASNYDGQPSEYQPHAMSAWVLTTRDTFSLRSSTPGAASYLSVADSFRNSFSVRYLYGFSYNGFAYFVTIQNKGRASRTSDTLLTRVCESDLLFETYMELPIRCPLRADGSKKSEKRIAISAAFDHSPTTNIFHHKILAVAFGSPFGGIWNSSDPSQGSELCFFDMGSVEEAFRETIRSCNNGSRTATLIEYFGKNQLDSNCAPTNQSGKDIDTCKPGANAHIGSLVPLIGRATLHFQEGFVTSITVMQQNGVIVAWVGDNSGYLHKVKLKDGTSKLLFWTDLANGSDVPIGKSTAVDKEGSNGYFLLRGKVVKFPVGSCSIYQTCSRCLRGHEDPLRCGWCDGRCAHAAECPNATDLVFDRCPVEVDMVNPKNGPITGRTMLTFLGDNFGYWWREPSNSIKITVSGLPCRIVNWVSTLVKCQTPAFEKAAKVNITISVNDTNRDTDKTYDVIDTLTIPEVFEYKVAVLTGVIPPFGPRAGGTNITLRGLNLDIGSHRIATVGGNLCKIHKFNETEVECTTAAVHAHQVHKKMQVTLSIDGAVIPYEDLPTKFTYMPDPIIDGISPGTANFSEAPTFEAKGVHLDSIYNPRIVIRVVSIGEEPHSITKACHVLQNGQKMVCPRPSLAEISANSSAELLAHRRNIPAQISFKMDGCHLPSPCTGSKGYFTFNYCPEVQTDGCNDEIQEIKVTRLTTVHPRRGPVAGGTYLTLFGENLDAGSVRIVRIGASQCNINSVSSAFLNCATSAVAEGEAGTEQRVILTIDSNEVPFDQGFPSIFTYKPDPVIYEFVPPRGIFRGSSYIVVRGKHLDSTSAPSMLTEVSSDSHHESDTGGVCSVQLGGRSMRCPVASAAGFCASGGTIREAHAFRVGVRISFQMDGLRLQANGTPEERHFYHLYCTFQRDAIFRTLPHEKLDIEKTATAIHGNLGIVTAIVFVVFLVTFLVTAISVRRHLFYRWLCVLKEKNKFSDNRFGLAASKRAGFPLLLAASKEKGCDQGFCLHNEAPPLDSSLGMSNIVQPMFNRKWLSNHVRPGVENCAIEQSLIPEVAVQQGSGNRREDVHRQRI